MPIHYLAKNQLFPEAVKYLRHTAVALDIGCGIMPQRLIRPKVHICWEPSPQYIQVLQEKTKNEFDRTYIILRGTWVDAVEMFPPKSVDSVFLLDVIEHLEKAEGASLLKKTERIASAQIIVFTPLGFIPQHHADGKDAWGLDGGSWQEHRSGWLPRDFDPAWKVFVANQYHDESNTGEKYPEPYGAMLALKDIPASEPRGGGAPAPRAKAAEYSGADLVSNFRRLEEELRKTQQEVALIHRSRAWRLISALRAVKRSLPLIKKL